MLIISKSLKRDVQKESGQMFHHNNENGKRFNKFLFALFVASIRDDEYEERRLGLSEKSKTKFENLRNKLFFCCCCCYQFHQRDHSYCMSSIEYMRGCNCDHILQHANYGCQFTNKKTRKNKT